MNRLCWILWVSALSSAQASSVVIDVRLLTPVRSTGAHASDQTLEAVLIKPLIYDGQVWMPAHTLLHGNVRRVRGVGVGLRRERASLEIGFTSWGTPDGNTSFFDATPLSVDNAREQVDKKGRIQGILAASNPLGIVRGVWYKPSTRLFFQGPAGLSGAGTVWAKLALGPIGSLGLLGARMLLTRLPDPEIDLPVGTEMALGLDSQSLDQSWGDAPVPAQLDPVLARFMVEQPIRIEKADGAQTPDIINLALMGSAALVEESFLASGWVTADALDRGSFGRTYKAFTQRQGYSTSPVSKLYYEGRLPDLVFQKSLNSIAKRHHVRLWRTITDGGEEAWLGAATHDVTVVFDRKNFGLSHRVDLSIDLEREKVVQDLDFAQASEETAYVPRVLNLSGGARTDSALAVVRLKQPAEWVAIPESEVYRPEFTVVHRFARRMILEARQYLLRENAYYLTYSLGRKIFARSQPILLESDSR